MVEQFPDTPFYFDANSTDGTDPSKVDRVYKDGTRIASNNAKAIAEREGKEAAEVVRREELVARVRTFTNGSEISMNVKDIRDALRAVAELAGIEL